MEIINFISYNTEVNPTKVAYHTVYRTNPKGFGNEIMSFAYRSDYKVMVYIWTLKRVLYGMITEFRFWVDYHKKDLAKNN